MPDTKYPTPPPLPTMDDHQDMILDGGTIGVVVTSYNQPEYIAESVRSVADQDWPHIRVVVVDDGSADGGEAARQAVASLPEPRRACFSVLCTANQGPSRARNTGFAALPRNCSHVLFVDGDDLLFPDALTVLYSGMGDAPAAAGCVVPIRGDGSFMPRAEWFPKYLPHRVTPEMHIPRWLFITPGTTLWRRRAFEAVGGWPDTLRGPDGEDWRGEDVMLAVYVSHEIGPMAGISIPVLLKREHERSYCQSDMGRLNRASQAYQDAATAYLATGKR